MKILTSAILIFSIAFSLIILSPQTLFAQDKVVGRLSISEIPSAAGKTYVTVNGENAEDGRSIIFPAEITTPSNIEARILIPDAGFVNISANSKLSLSYENSLISGTLQTGEYIVNTSPEIGARFSTPGGVITIPVSDKLNRFEVTIIDGKTTVYSIFGSTRFDNVTVPAGEFYPNPDKTKVAKKSGNNNLIYLGVGAAVIVGILVALSSSSGGNDNVVSPVR